MEKVKLKKTNTLTDFTRFIESSSLERVNDGNEYQYLAKLSDYDSENSVKREIQKEVIQLVGDKNYWSLCVDTNFLHDLKEGEIFELCVSFYFSRKYLRRHSSCFVVLKNTKTHILLGIASSAFQIFKQTSFEFKSDTTSSRAKQKAIKALEKIQEDFNVQGKIKFEKFKEMETNASWMMKERVYILEGSNYGYQYGLSTGDCVIEKRGWFWVYYLDCNITSDLASEVKMKLEQYEKENELLRQQREAAYALKTNEEKVMEHLDYAKGIVHTNYHKIMIEGHTGIYLAHPEYLHRDYNKHRLFDKTEETLRLMKFFNEEIEAYRLRTIDMAA